MAKGNQIIVSSQPKGTFLEGIIGDTSKPGTVMQVQAATAMKGGGGGEPTWIAANTGTDGKAALKAILLEDSLQGFGPTTAYVSGTKCLLYVPAPGEYMNLLVGEVAGTGNTYAIGDRLILDAEDGIMVPESGSPQQTFAICMEVVTQVAGAHLTWCLIL